MAVVPHLVYRTVSGGYNRRINDIQAVVIAIDDTVDTSAALIQARAVTVLVAAGVPLPTGYFNANLAGAAFATAGEYVLLGQVITIAAT